MESKRKAYMEKLDAQFAMWDTQIMLLRAKAEKARAEQKISYYHTIKQLQHKQKEAITKLHELKTAGDESWEDMKVGAEKVWSDVKLAYRDAISRFS